MRIQYKLTITFVILALFSTVMAATIAYYMVKDDFDKVTRAAAFETFQAAYSAYVAAYGGVEAAMTTEPFDAFAQRTHRLKPMGDGQSAGHLAMDLNGIVLFPAAGYKIGETVSGKAVDEATPIEVGGQPVALAMDVGGGMLSDHDSMRLSSLRQSLITGVIVALILSVLLGYFMGRGVSTSLRKLAEAIGMMRSSTDEVYQIEVVSDDELGKLTEHFNEMNLAMVEAREEMRKLAIRDPLTNLYNRGHFDEQLRQFFESATRYEQPLSVMVGDLDNFRQINDDFSHEMGDLVLEKVAEIMMTTTRKSDVVARYGDEELVVLFANTDASNASVSSEKIRQAVEAHPWHEFHPDLVVTMSIGLCDSTDQTSSSAMLTKANQLLGEAKAGGRNRLVSG